MEEDDHTDGGSRGDADAPARDGDDGLTRVLPASDLDEGERVIVDVAGVEVAVFDVGGEYHAIANYCTHQGGPVAEGLVSGTMSAEMTDEGWDLYYERDDRLVACPWHGWQFDIATGEHVAESRYRLPTYEVVVRDGDLYVRR